MNCVSCAHLPAAPQLLQRPLATSELTHFLPSLQCALLPAATPLTCKRSRFWISLGARSTTAQNCTSCVMCSPRSTEWYRAAQGVLRKVEQPAGGRQRAAAARRLGTRFAALFCHHIPAAQMVMCKPLHHARGSQQCRQDDCALPPAPRPPYTRGRHQGGGDLGHNMKN